MGYREKTSYVPPAQSESKKSNGKIVKIAVGALLGVGLIYGVYKGTPGTVKYVQQSSEEKAKQKSVRLEVSEIVQAKLATIQPEDVNQTVPFTNPATNEKGFYIILQPTQTIDGIEGQNLKIKTCREAKVFAGSFTTDENGEDIKNCVTNFDPIAPREDLLYGSPATGQTSSPRTVQELVTAALNAEQSADVNKSFNFGNPEDDNGYPARYTILPPYQTFEYDHGKLNIQTHRKAVIYNHGGGIGSIDGDTYEITLNSVENIAPRTQYMFAPKPPTAATPPTAAKISP